MKDLTASSYEVFMRYLRDSLSDEEGSATYTKDTSNRAVSDCIEPPTTLK